MFSPRIGLAALAFAATAALGGCADGYGYGGVSAGYGSGYYDDGYYGWYGDYYYPGTGYYVYDRDRRPHRWNDGQRRYWEGRRGHRGNRGDIRDNWQGFTHAPGQNPQGFRNGQPPRQQVRGNPRPPRENGRGGRRPPPPVVQRERQN
jgi:hypothetical protein